DAADNAGSVEIESYAPKRIVLKVKATAESVLLLTDRYDVNWRVSVGGKPDTLLKWSYLMRGGHLGAGVHSVEFSFRPRMGVLYVSLRASAVAVGVWGMLRVRSRDRCQASKTAASARPKSAELDKQARAPGPSTVSVGKNNIAPGKKAKPGGATTSPTAG